MDDVRDGGVSRLPRTGLYCASTLSSRWRYRNGKTVALIWPIDKMVELVITELVQCSLNIR